MQLPWQSLRHVPAPVLTAVKRITSARFRLWLRERTGGSANAIPDMIKRVPDGRQFHIGPDLIYWPIYHGLEFEPEAAGVFRRLVRPGDTVIDAGANYGWYSTLLGLIVGDQGRVIAFEPVPTTHDRLIENIHLNGLCGVVVAHRAALADQSGERVIHVFDGLSHARSSLSRLDRDDFTGVMTPVTTIDEQVQAAGVEGVAFLKCDVEGAELAVLKGGNSLLSRADAPIVAVELNDETSSAMGYSTRDLAQQLRSYGYDHFYSVASSSRLDRIESPAALNSTSLLVAGKGSRVSDRFHSHVACPAA